ncbi:flippase-like domain-containing protein [Candidatus Saccharibacteria bacterium]|nr:flippase-like domain-containing protein [Candidatus Saccharibacteria bacterium]
MSSKKKPSWKKIVGIILFVALNVAVIAITATNEFGNSESAAELSEVHIEWWLLIPAVLLFALATLVNVYKYVLMIRRSFKKSERPANRKIWKTAWRVVMLGKYYDNITPAAIGGQPFQIYYMHKESGLSSGHATSIPIFGMVAGQIGFLILAIPCFIVGTVTGFRPALMTLAWIGLLFYAFWPAMIAGISYMPKQTTKFLQFLTKVMARLKVVKNRDEALVKIESEVKAYAKSVKMIMQTRGLFLKTIVLSTFYQAMIMMIPFFVLTAFGGNVGFLGCLMMSMAVTSSVYFVPTPGNAGAAEGTFYLVFSSLSTGYVFWAMLFWRFLSYYIYIIIGPLIYLKKSQEKTR